MYTYLHFVFNFYGNIIGSISSNIDYLVVGGA